MSLSHLTRVALKIDSENKNLTDGDLTTANERFHPSPPPGDVTSEDQWSYKEALTAALSAEDLTKYSDSLIRLATNFTYRQHSETLSGNPNYGGQNVAGVDFDNPSGKRVISFYELIGNDRQNRLEDAYTLIMDYKDWILAAPSFVQSTNSLVNSDPESKCYRDIGFFLDAVAYDLRNGGNSRTYDYAMISRKALQDQGNPYPSIFDDYKLVINGTSNNTATDESIRNRLAFVLDGSAEVNGPGGDTVLDETGITVAEDDCQDVVSVAQVLLDLVLKILQPDDSSLSVARTGPYNDQNIGEGRLNDAAKLITNEDSSLYTKTITGLDAEDFSGGSITFNGLRGWICNPPSISDTTTFSEGKCPRDLGFFIDAIAYNLIRGGNGNVYDAAKLSAEELSKQADRNENVTSEELVQNYELAINGSSDGEGFRDRLVNVIRGTAIVGSDPTNLNPMDLDTLGVTPSPDRCSDVVSAAHAYVDIILLIIKEGPSAVERTQGVREKLYKVDDNRQAAPGEAGYKYKQRPYSFDKVQISKCLRDVDYYLRYITYGLVANDFGIIDVYFLNGLQEINKSFGLLSSWYKSALQAMIDELNQNESKYFGTATQTETMPSDGTQQFTISPSEKKDKAIEFITYVHDRI